MTSLLFPSGFRSRYASRLAPNGGFILEVAAGKCGGSGKHYVEVVLERQEFRELVERNSMRSTKK